jgi:hypothetical protein
MSTWTRTDELEALVEDTRAGIRAGLDVTCYAIAIERTLALGPLDVKDENDRWVEPNPSDFRPLAIVRQRRSLGKRGPGLSFCRSAARTPHAP